MSELACPKCHLPLIQVGHTYQCENHHNYDISKNVYMKEAYSQRGWGFVSDYVRLDVVYQMGDIFRY